MIVLYVFIGWCIPALLWWLLIGFGFWWAVTRGGPRCSWTETRGGFPHS
jgi:hypothetical protein